MEGDNRDGFVRRMSKPPPEGVDSLYGGASSPLAYVAYEDFVARSRLHLRDAHASLLAAS